MAGFTMRFVLDDAELMAQVDGLIARGGDLSEPLDDIGQDMVSITIRAFEDSRSPEGVAWQPSAAAVAEGRKTLIDRGQRGGLMGSQSYVVGPRGVTYGTNIVYAAIHQSGGSISHAGRQGTSDAGTGFGQTLAEAIITFPARPFIGRSDADQARWADTLAEYLAGSTVGGAA
jgi:phage gpG-like protein